MFGDRAGDCTTLRPVAESFLATRRGRLDDWIPYAKSGADPRARRFVYPSPRSHEDSDR